MIVVGLTGGIASGKTTITNFLKKNRYMVHDSENVIKNWGRMKKEESKNDKFYLKNITNTLPSLSFAYELYRKSSDINFELVNTDKYDNFSKEQIINILFELTSSASKKNIDLENEFRKYIKAKQLDIIKKI